MAYLTTKTTMAKKPHMYAIPGKYNGDDEEIAAAREGECRFTSVNLLTVMVM